MTWEILAALIALATFGIAIGKIISNNTKAMTELKCSIEELRKSLTETQKRQDELEKKIREIKGEVYHFHHEEIEREK